MSYRRRICAAIAIAAFAVLGACQRRQAHVVERVAILPLENLLSDGGLEWVPRAAQFMLQHQLTGVGNLMPLTAANTREAKALHAERAVEGYLSGDANLLRLSVVVEDLASLKASSTIEITGPRQKGVMPLLDQLAKTVNPLARPLSTSSETALQSWATGDFAGAVKTDPAFGAPYVNWLAQLRAKGDREAGLEVLSKASMQGTKLSDLDRAQLAVASAWLKPADQNARRAALMDLAGIVKYDTQLFRELSEAAQQARNFKASAEWLEKALAVEPGDTNTLNSLGYAYGLTGDVAAAERTMAQYRELAPGDTNAFDSLGEIYFVNGKFAEAERAFAEGFEKNPQFLGGALMFKAALSRLMTGDGKGASDLFAKLLELKQPGSEQQAEARRANWEFLTGERKAALVRMAKVEGAAGKAQLAMLLLLSGDRAGARQLAERAMQGAGGERQLAPIVLFLTGPATQLAEWRQAAERFFGAQNAAQREQHVGYALFLQGRYGDAADALGPLVANANPLTSGLQKELLAASLAGAGRTDEAARLTALYPIPDPNTGLALWSLIFPRMFETRAVVLDKQGKVGEAKAMRELAAKFAPR